MEIEPEATRKDSKVHSPAIIRSSGSTPVKLTNPDSADDVGKGLFGIPELTAEQIISSKEKTPLNLLQGRSGSG